MKKNNTRNKLLTLKYVDRREIKIHSSADSAWLLSQTFKSQVAVERIPSVGLDQPPFELPLAQAANGMFHVVANWRSLERLKNHADPIPIIVQVSRFSRDVEKQAWSYCFSLIGNSLHKNHILKSAISFIELCPPEIQSRIFEPNAARSILSAAKLLNVSRGTFSSVKRWVKQHDK